MAVIQATTLNSGIAIVPNGTGAITADVPDGTVAGGDTRGNFAVDLQMGRSTANQVAVRDYTVVLGGQNNASDGDDGRWGSVVGGLSNRQRTAYGAIVGGQSNQTGDGNAANSHIFIGGGSSNYSNGSYSVITGGRSNTTGSAYCVVSGGQSNTASTGSHATVVGGQSNVSSGGHSVSGGSSNTASGARSLAIGIYCIASGNESVAFGQSNTASGQQSFSVGRDNISSNTFSFSQGRNSLAYLYSQSSQGSGSFDLSKGNAQASNVVARKFDDLTTGGTTVLSLDGTGTTNLIIPNGNNRVWNVVSSWVAVVIGTSGTTTGVNVGDVITQCNLFAFKKIGGISSVVGSVTNVATHNDASMASASMGYTAGASQELALTFQAPTFSGGGSVTLRIVNKLMLTEVAY